MNQCAYCNKNTTNPKFCSRSCGVSYNNTKNPKRIAITKKCKNCRESYTGKNATYCSLTCSKTFHHNNMIENNTYTSQWHPRIRKYLINKNGNNCMVCGMCADNWQGNPLTLIVDHIDGDAYNYNVDNIQLVCPNCDSQLPTYKGRNKGKSTRKYTIVQK